MSKKTQADKMAAMVQQSQSLRRPSNLDESGKAKPVKPKGARITVGTKALKEIAHYWTIQAKIKRRPVADVVRDALIVEFGLPEGFSKEDI